MDEQQKRSAMDQRAEALSNYAFRQASAGIPARYRDKTFYPTWSLTKEHSEALDAIEDYARNFPDYAKDGQCLIMSGGVGTGKTYAACLIANYVLKNRLRVRYHTEISLAQFVREKNWEARDRTAQLVEVDLLVIDEVGLVNLDDRDRAIITEVVNGRYNNNGPMIIASNAPFTSADNFNLKSVLGDRVVDRLKEMGGPRLFFNWQSLRGK